ncbi:hypothetical protein FNV43_RR13075 [Rhamnella rubrinervis]|uniref:Uncharacterized protein n=1 Tax=Rhamnella rubrinervis TaxID=2594499 RepID=A0A8K0MET6_9ROSA|nr:hypothetical protein FNV43_RR13075 [Rhamnella rubrinervis]
MDNHLAPLGFGSSQAIVADINDEEDLEEDTEEDLEEADSSERIKDSKDFMDFEKLEYHKDLEDFDQ